MHEIQKKRKISDGIRRSTYTKNRAIIENRSVPAVDNFRLASNQIAKPRAKKIIRKDSGSVETQEGSDFNQVPENFQTGKKRTSIFTWIQENNKLIRFFVFSCGYLAILFFVFSRLENTQINLTPKTLAITENQKVIAHLDPLYNELGFDIIALSDSRSKTITVTGTTQVNERASGTIKIFNNYSSEPQNLSPNTRFKSLSGKVFMLGDEGIVIPGKSENAPGEIEATVFAAEPGPDYNIDVTDFTIPGFKESGLQTKYDGIYGLSVKKFTGGFSGTKPKLSDTERAAVITELSIDLKQLLLKRLDAEKTNKVLLVDNSIQLRLGVAEIESVNEGEIKITQDAKLFALLVEKTQLEKYLQKKYISDVVSEQVKLLSFDNINFDYEHDLEIDFKNLKTISLNMQVQNTFVWSINTQLLAESLHGLDFNQGILILREFDEIDAARIDVRPFWQKNISPDVNNVSISIMDTTQE